ncbi:MAG: Cna B-type domain-containing protein, partial [Abiotrophia defectiva]|nr:Cna B-type domain-containing protein [Abiotrophia defectiva]
MAATAGGVAKAAGVLTQDGDNYLLTVPLNAIDRTTSGSFPFSIKFKDRLTPDGYSVQPRVAIRQADRRVIAGPSSDLTFNVKADKPQLQKLVKGNTLDMFVQQDVYGGETDGGDYLNSKAADVPFYFFLSPQGITNQTIQEYRANQTYRSYETIVIKDTLPTYEGVGGQTLTATFDPAKNPGWTDNGDGTVSYTVTNPDPASGGAETTLRNVRLRLSFPNAKYKNGNKQIVHKNNVELTMTPYQQGPSEPATVLNDDVPFTLTSELVPAGMFRKIANNASRLRLQPQANHVVEAFWSLAFRNTSALPVTQLVMEDTQLDPRMYAYSLTVSGTLNIPLEIYGVGEDGSETYLDTLSRTKRSIENIDDQAWAQVQEQVAKVQNGEIKDTEAVAATRKYKGIRIKLPAGEKHMPTTGFALQYRTRLLDPYNTKLLTDEKFYNNTATLDVALETEDGSEVRPRQLTSSARFIADKLEETVQFDKTTKVNQTGTLGEQVVYRLVFSNFVVSPARAYRNAKFIDILPQGVTFKSASEELAADKGKIKNVEVVENYNNSGRTAVIIDLGTIPAFSDTKPNFPILVEGTINEGAIPSKIQNANNNEDNHAYFISDEYDPLPDGIKSTSLVDNKFGIQVNGKTPAQLVGASSVTTVNLPSEIASTKYIRRKGESFHTKPVITDYDEAFDYRLQTRNFSVLPMRHFVLYDRLPYSGDINTSKFSNLLTGPLTVPEKYTVYYHTAADMTKNAGQEVGRDGWMTADQVADFTQVTAIKIVLNQGEVVEPGEIINFNVPMKAPAYTNGYINREKATNFFSTNRDANDLTSFGDTNAVVNQLPQYIPVAKKWVKEKNLDQVVFELFRKSQPRDVLASMTLNEANGWKGIFKRLDNGQLLDPNVTDYDVREVLPERYALDYNITSTYDATNPGSDEDEHVYEITNERKVRPYYVVKKWEDDNNRLGKRVPIKVQLKQNGQDYRDPLDITEADRWEITIPDLPIITNVKEIEYSADELNVPAGYYKEVVSNGNTTTITNKLPLPTGENVTSEGIQGASQTGTPSFTPGKVTIGGKEVEVPLKADSYRLVVNGQAIDGTSTPALSGGVEVGTYTLDQSTGQVTFQPKKDFVGTPDPVTVQVSDTNDKTATATYTPTVVGTKPSGQDKETQDIQGKTQSTTLTFTPGTANVGGTDYTVPLKDNSLRFVVDGAVSEETQIDAKDAAGKVIGRYTLDPASGQVTFEPNKDFVGTAAPAIVRAWDSNDMTADASYTPTVVGVVPNGSTKETTHVQGHEQSGLVEFTPGNEQVPMDDQVDAVFDNGEKEITIPKEGTYRVAKDGTVTFTPEKTFVGDGTGVTVVRVDKNGTKARGKYIPHVLAVKPSAQDAETTDIQGKEQVGQLTFTPGTTAVDGQDYSVPMAANSLQFLVDGQASTETIIPAKDANGKEIGTYTLNQNGQVTFQPNKDFVGDPVPVQVQAKDENGTPVVATYTPHVTGVKPVGVPATSTGIRGASQSKQVTFQPGHADVPMDDQVPAKLKDAQGQLVESLKVDNQGTYTVAADGTVTFVPEKNFVGPAQAVTVVRVDKNGTPAEATYTPTVVDATPTSTNAETTDVQGQVQEGTVSFAPGQAQIDGQAVTVPLVENSLVFVVDGQVVQEKEIDAKDTDGKTIGTYKLNSETGQVTFTPHKDYVGTPVPATIQAHDTNDVTVTATYQPHVTGVTPSGKDVSSSGLQGASQTGQPVFTPGDAKVPITINDEQPAQFFVGGQAVTETSLPAMQNGV